MKLFFFILTLFISGRSLGCDCTSNIDAGSAKTVFVGEVLNVQRVNDATIGFAITFKVRSVSKGKVKTKEKIIFVESLTQAGCGVDFKLNQVYEVYTFEESGLEWTGLCTETRLMENNTINRG
jgi:hypothetical protein